MKKYKEHRIAEKLILIYLLLFISMLMISSCCFLFWRSVANIKTESIVFQCDRHINQGMLLPVDVIYITRYHSPREVISIGPNKWFNSLERERWGTRQTLSLRGGETQILKLNKLWLKNTRLIIIFANFKDVKDPHSQQTIIDRSGKQTEKILVMPQSLAVDKKTD